MSNLKNDLIRLGSQSPELRKHLRPILDRISGVSGEVNSRFEEDELYWEGTASVFVDQGLYWGVIKRLVKEGVLPPDPSSDGSYIISSVYDTWADQITEVGDGSAQEASVWAEVLPDGTATVQVEPLNPVNPEYTWKKYAGKFAPSNVTQDHLREALSYVRDPKWCLETLNKTKHGYEIETFRDGDEQELYAILDEEARNKGIDLRFSARDLQGVLDRSNQKFEISGSGFYPVAKASLS